MPVNAYPGILSYGPLGISNPMHASVHVSLFDDRYIGIYITISDDAILSLPLSLSFKE